MKAYSYTYTPGYTTSVRIGVRRQQDKKLFLLHYWARDDATTTELAEAYLESTANPESILEVLVFPTSRADVFGVKHKHVLTPML